MGSMHLLNKPLGELICENAQVVDFRGSLMDQLVVVLTCTRNEFMEFSSTTRDFSCETQQTPEVLLGVSYTIPHTVDFLLGEDE